MYLSEREAKILQDKVQKVNFSIQWKQKYIKYLLWQGNKPVSQLANLSFYGEIFFNLEKQKLGVEESKKLEKGMELYDNDICNVQSIV